ncbi:Hypothetical predicted protein [Prunus dulcis]|uniref:Uncharacterized protein n=1 Tax=Prunus dulcis TaxID=3755 RepID=A0A5E4F166_PRUDU|nr:Hypothetical predicted protein [Prunus dulcis]
MESGPSCPLEVVVKYPDGVRKVVQIFTKLNFQRITRMLILRYLTATHGLSLPLRQRFLRGVIVIIVNISAKP